MPLDLSAFGTTDLGYDSSSAPDMSGATAVDTTSLNTPVDPSYIDLPATSNRDLAPVPDTSGTPWGDILNKAMTGVSGLVNLWGTAQNTQLAIDRQRVAGTIAQKQLDAQAAIKSGQIDLAKTRALADQSVAQYQARTAAQTAISATGPKANKLGPLTYEQWGLVLSVAGLAYAVRRRAKG